MNKIQEILVNSYATLVMAKKITIEQVPEARTFGATEYTIREEVEVEVAQRTVAALS
ncbi:CD1375 family protein [Vallitaleaceae bacterium 9-2]